MSQAAEGPSMGVGPCLPQGHVRKTAAAQAEARDGRWAATGFLKSPVQSHRAEGGQVGRPGPLRSSPAGHHLLQPRV